MTCRVHNLALNQADSDPSQVPADVLKFVAKKKAIPSEHYSDVWAEEHKAAFAVARATEINVVESMQEAVKKALAEGLPFKQFAQQVTPALQDAGWWGKRESDGVQLGSPHRLKIIYDTNIRTARAAGQWRRIQEAKQALPYLRYRHGNPQRPRPDHEAWDGRVLPVDHPFWNYAYPPNGYLCTCWVEQVTSRDAKRSGVTPDEALDMEPIEVESPSTGRKVTTIRGVDPTFAYNPGKARMDGLKQAGVVKGKQSTPEPKPVTPADPPSTRVGATAEKVFGRKITDRELDSLVGLDAKLPAGLQTKIKHVSENEKHGEIRVFVDVLDAQGTVVASITRRFDRDEHGVTEAHHASFFVEDEYQGSGLGKAIFNAQIDAYKRTGLIKNVTLDAAFVGRYVWTKAGFKWRPEHVRDLLGELKTRLMSQLGNDVAHQIMTQVKTPQDVARLEIDGQRIGKNLLLEFLPQGKSAETDQTIPMEQTVDKIKRL